MYRRLLVTAALLTAGPSLFSGCRAGSGGPKTLSADTGSGSPAAAEDVSPWPARLLVRVQNLEGDAVEGAYVTIHGAGVRTDANGDAAFYRIEPGEARLVVQANGYATAVSALMLGENSLYREEVILAPITSAGAPDDAFDDEDGGWSSSIVVEGLVDVSGVASGDSLLQWTAYGPMSPALSTLTEDGDGFLVPLSAITVSAQDDRGRWLQADSAGVDWMSTVSLDVLAALALDEDCEGEVGLWVQDPESGRWGAVTEGLQDPFSVGGGLALPANVYGSGTYAIAQQKPAGCLEVQPGECAGLEALPLEVEVVTGGRTHRQSLSAHAPTARFLVPAGEVTVALLANQTEIASSTVEVREGDACASVDLGLTCAGLAVVLQTEGYCPANVGRIEVLDSAGELNATWTGEGGLAIFPSLDEGAWTVVAYDQSENLLGSGEVEVSAAALSTLVLTVAGDAMVPMGGCAEPPCAGNACDACLNLTLTDESGDLAAGIDVSFHEPASTVVASDGDGVASVDVSDGAGAELLFLADLGATAYATLQAGADEGTCSALGSWVGAAEPTCASDQVAVTADVGLVDWRDPGIEGEAEDATCWNTTGSELYLSFDEGYPGLPDEAWETGISCSEAVAVHALESSTISRWDASGLRVTCQTSLSLSVQIDITWPDVLLAPGEVLDVATDGVALTISLVDMDTGADATLIAASGDLVVHSRGPDVLALVYDLGVTVEGERDARVSGQLAVPLISRANTERKGEHFREQELDGAFIRVVNEAGAEVVFGPTGVPPVDLGDNGHGNNPKLCLFNGVPGMEVGVEIDGLISPFTAMKVARAGAVRLWRNGAVGSLFFATSKLRYMRRETVEHLYELAGLDPGVIDSTALILGRPARWDPTTMSVRRMVGFESARLVNATGVRTYATPLDDNFKPVSAAVATWYAFYGVVPTTPDQSYTLSLRDATGTSVAEYAQRVAPVAGGLMLVAFDAMDP